MLRKFVSLGAFNGLWLILVTIKGDSGYSVSFEWEIFEARGRLMLYYNHML